MFRWWYYSHSDSLFAYAFIHTSPFSKVFALKGKNFNPLLKSDYFKRNEFFPFFVNLFLSELTIFQKGGKIRLAEFSLLNVYQFPFNEFEHTFATPQPSPPSPLAPARVHTHKHTHTHAIPSSINFQSGIFIAALSSIGPIWTGMDCRKNHTNAYY